MDATHRPAGTDAEQAAGEANAADVAAPDETAPPPEVNLGKLQHEIHIATRSAKYAMATAVTAALVSGGVAAWASVNVAGTQMDRQERLAEEQALRADRKAAYIDLLNTRTELIGQLGIVKGALLREPAEYARIRDAVDEAKDRMVALGRAEQAVLVVSTDMTPIIDRLADADHTLWVGPYSLPAVVDWASSHDLANDPFWPRIRADTIARLDQYSRGDATAGFFERVHADLGVDTSGGN